MEYFSLILVMVIAIAVGVTAAAWMLGRCVRRRDRGADDAAVFGAGCGGSGDGGHCH